MYYSYAYVRWVWKILIGRFNKLLLYFNDNTHEKAPVPRRLKLFLLRETDNNCIVTVLT